MDKLQWFKFSIADWRMGKIQRCPEVTQIRFLNLCCFYWNKECVLQLEDAEIEIGSKHINTLIEKRVISIDENECIIIDFLDKQMTNVLETSKKRRDSVNKRWANVKENNTSVLQVYKSVLQNDTDKSRVDKIRNIYDVFVNEVKANNWDSRIEALYMRLKIKKGALTPLLGDYQNHLITENRLHKDTNEFFKNFVNWLNTQDRLGKLDNLK